MLRRIYDAVIGKRGETVQTLLDKEKIKMLKYSEYVATDHDNKTSITYKFLFDNMARKNRFLDEIQRYKTQPWDQYVRWMSEKTVLNNEICVEARCLLPEAEVGKFKYDFERFVTKNLILES